MFTNIVAPIGGFLGVLTTLVAVPTSLWQLRLKVIEQTELLKNQKIESEIKLMNTFSSFVEIAEGRKEISFSDHIIDYLIKNIKSESISSLYDEIERIKKESILVAPAGIISQYAAIVAIFELGRSHVLLNEPALVALNKLTEFNDPIIVKYYEKLKELKRN